MEELRNIMQSLGEKMTEKELDEMVGEADKNQDGLINYEGWSTWSWVLAMGIGDWGIGDTDTVVK